MDGGGILELESGHDPDNENLQHLSNSSSALQGHHDNGSAISFLRSSKYEPGNFER